MQYEWKVESVQSLREPESEGVLASGIERRESVGYSGYTSRYGLITVHRRNIHSEIYTKIYTVKYT